MKKIITLILIAVAFALAASKPAFNKQFKDGEWWSCRTFETDEHGTVKNYITEEGAKYATSRDYQDGILTRLVEYGGVDRYFIRTVREQYFNSCKDIVEEHYDVPKHYNILRTFTYKYGENCQILEKHSVELYTDSLRKTNITDVKTKYTYKQNKVIEKSCSRYNHGDENCTIYTTVTNGNKSIMYYNKNLIRVETIIDENTKVIDWKLLVESTIYKTFKESDTKYHECHHPYLD